MLRDKSSKNYERVCGYQVTTAARYEICAYVCVCVCLCGQRCFIYIPLILYGPMGKNTYQTHRHSAVYLFSPSCRQFCVKFHFCFSGSLSLDIKFSTESLFSHVLTAVHVDWRGSTLSIISYYTLRSYAQYILLCTNHTLQLQNRLDNPFSSQYLLLHLMLHREFCCHSDCRLL